MLFTTFLGASFITDEEDDTLPLSAPLPSSGRNSELHRNVHLLSFFKYLTSFKRFKLLIEHNSG